MAFTDSPTTTSCRAPPSNAPAGTTLILRSVRHGGAVHRDARGRRLHRPPALPDRRLDQVDPFLLLDEMGPVDYAPGRGGRARPTTRTAASRPSPTCSRASSSTRTRPATAARIGRRRRAVDDRRRRHRALRDAVARRMPREAGGVHGFQIWVNLPARDQKMTAPALPGGPARRDIPQRRARRRAGRGPGRSPARPTASRARWRRPRRSLYAHVTVAAGRPGRPARRRRDERHGVRVPRVRRGRRRRAPGRASTSWRSSSTTATRCTSRPATTSRSTCSCSPASRSASRSPATARS